MKTLVLFALAACFALSSSAQISSFKDVEYEGVSREDGKVKKADGMIHLDRSARLVSFSSDNRVLCNIRYEEIEAMSYDEKSKMLQVRFKVAGAGDLAKFKLDGGNRNDILSRLEVQSGKPLTRVTRK